MEQGMWASCEIVKFGCSKVNSSNPSTFTSSSSYSGIYICPGIFIYVVYNRFDILALLCYMNTLLHNMNSTGVIG